MFEYAMVLVLLVGGLFWFYTAFLTSTQKGYDSRKSNLNFREENVLFKE